MSTSTTHQQSLADASSETRPPMLERGLYEFKEFTPSETEEPRMHTKEDLRGDDLKHYEAEIEARNLILISIPNDIYNSFDQFVAEPGEALVSVYNHFAQLINDLEQNDIKFPKVTVNTKFLNCLQPEWLKTTSPYYVIHPSLVVDYDDHYQGDAIQNTSEDPLTSAMILLAHAITQRFSNPTNNRLHTSSNTRNQAIVQGDRVNIQNKNSGNDGRNTRCSYVQEEIIKGNNVQNDVGNIQRTL
ncbi:hypothetical protein Tco_1150128 [Tanacetum coccineum]